MATVQEMELELNNLYGEIAEWGSDLAAADYELAPYWEGMEATKDAINRTHGKHCVEDRHRLDLAKAGDRKVLFEERLALSIVFGKKVEVRRRLAATVRGFQREAASLERQITRDKAKGKPS